MMRDLEPEKVYGGRQLTTFVIVDSKTMDELHPSGVPKKVFARQALKDFFDKRFRGEGSLKPFYSVVRNFEEYAEVILWPTASEDIARQSIDYPTHSPLSVPGLAIGLETALCIIDVFSRQGDMYQSKIVIITDGNDADKQKTREIINRIKKLYQVALFVYFLPSANGESFDGYEYCSSIGHTHKWLGNEYDPWVELGVVLHLDDIDFNSLQEFFTGYNF